MRPSSLRYCTDRRPKIFPGDSAPEMAAQDLAVSPSGTLITTGSSGHILRLNPFNAASFPPLIGGGNAATVRTFDQGSARYRLGVFLQATNLTNRPNFFGYSGAQLSPFFGKQATSNSVRE